MKIAMTRFRSSPCEPRKETVRAQAASRIPQTWKAFTARSLLTPGDARPALGHANTPGRRRGGLGVRAAPRRLRRADARVRIAARVLLFSWATMVAGAFAADPYSPPTPDAFVRGIRSYPFIAPTARREKIRTGVPQLARCMTSAQVRKLLARHVAGEIAVARVAARHV